MRLTASWAVAFRVVRGGGRGASTRLMLVAAATAVATCAVLLALHVPGARSARHQRLEAREPSPTHSQAEPAGGYYYERVDGSLAGLPFTRVFLAAAADDSNAASLPAPPGLDGFPLPGQTFVSPTLAKRLSRQGSLAAVIPGAVSGVIRDGGLTRPDELFAYVGVDDSELEDTTRDFGFGRKLVSEESDGVLVLAELGALIVVPSVAFVAVCARLASRQRERRWSALRAVGTPESLNRRVNAVELVVGAVPGLIIGMILFATVGRGLGRWHRVGLSWAQSDGRVSPVSAILAMIIGSYVMWRLGGRALRAPADHNSPDRQKRWIVAAASLLLGVLILSMTIIIGFTERRMSSAPVLLVGVVSSVAGLLSLGRWAVIGCARVLARQVNSFPVRLAARRAEFEPSSIVRVLTGLSTIVIVTYVALGALEDARLVAGDAASEAITTVQFASAEQATSLRSQFPAGEGVALVAEATSNLDDPQWANLVAASCDDVIRWSGAEVSDCVDGETYRLGTQDFASDLAPGVTYRFASAGGFAEIESPAAELVLGPIDSPRSLGTNALLVTGPEANSLIMARVRARVPADDYDAFESAVASIDPLIAVQSTRDPIAVQRFRDHRAVIVLGTVVGCLLAAMTFVVASIDRLIERRRNVAALVAIGVSTTEIRRVQIAQVLLPLLATLLSANIVGWLIAQAYLSFGGLTRSLFLEPWFTGALISAAIALIAVVAVAVVSVPTALSEHLQPE